MLSNKNIIENPQEYNYEVFYNWNGMLQNKSVINNFYWEICNIWYKQLLSET